MDIANDGQVWIGCQFEGPKADLPPVIFTLQRGVELSKIEVPEIITRRLANYIGSICASHDRKTILVTSPKGNRAITLDANSGKVISMSEHQAVCGVASNRNGWALSSLNGELNGKTTSLYWDNHLKNKGLEISIDRAKIAFFANCDIDRPVIGLADQSAFLRRRYLSHFVNSK